MGFVRPRDHGVIGIGEFRLEVGTREVVPAEAIGFGDAAGGGVIGDGLFTIAIHGVAHIATEGVPMAGEGLGLLQFRLLLDPLAHKYLSSMRRLAKTLELPKP